MVAREPIAFLSYVRSDDAHESGRISELRLRLEGEIKMQTGRPFHIFQDRNDIAWGQNWADRIDSALLDVNFLIPIITPSFFQSPFCRKEVETFLRRERELGEDRLVLPVYYVECDEFETSTPIAGEVEEVLRRRNYFDWRHLRFEGLDSFKVRSEVAALAMSIKEAMRDLRDVFSASKKKEKIPVEVRSVREATKIIRDISEFSPEIPVICKGEFEPTSPENSLNAPYYVYTNKFDETIRPSDICSPTDKMLHHTFLMKRLRSELNENRNEIEIESAAIQAELGKEDISLTFLVDNSGSMRGAKILGVACWISIISSILSKTSASYEILGYTTRAWKGGQAREMWLMDGKPEHPGRLNDVRYIVYKNFDESFDEASTNFGVMLREGILKENIDGEAMLWAYSRLQNGPAGRKMMFVVSDGAPVDDSTLSVNGPEFLSAHVIETAKWITGSTDIELYGIGINHDVSDYLGIIGPKIGSSIGIDLLRIISLAICRKWPEAVQIQKVDEVLTAASGKKKTKRSR